MSSLILLSTPHRGPSVRKGCGMGTAAIPRQPSELRSSRGHAGAEQSPEHANSRAWHHGHCQPSTPSQSHSSPSLPTPRPTAPSQLRFPTAAGIQDFGAVQSSTLQFLQPCGRLRPVSRRGDHAQPSLQHPWLWHSLCPAPEPPENWGAAWHIQWDPHLARSRREAAGKTGSVPHTSSPFLQPAGMEPPPSPSSPPPSPPPPPASQPGTSLFSLRPGWGGDVGGQGKAGSPQPPPR